MVAADARSLGCLRRVHAASKCRGAAAPAGCARHGGLPGQHVCAANRPSTAGDDWVGDETEPEAAEGAEERARGWDQVVVRTIHG